jgi:hypothetical protein
MFDFLYHFLLPRESNNHRAKLLHPHLLFFLVVVLLEIAFFSSQIEQRYPEVLGIQANISVEDLLTLTNQRRAEVGLQPLTLNEELSKAAQMKSQDMLTKNYWAHNAPDGTTPWVFIRSSGYEYIYAGENLARGFTTAPEVVSAWMASPGHRDNMLSPNYKDIGFAIASGVLAGDDTILVVEEFGSKSTAIQSVGSAQHNVSKPTVIPTNIIAQISPVITVIPTLAPTLLPVSPLSSQPSNSVIVAGVKNTPLIDKAGFSRILALLIAGLFVGIFIVDMFVVKQQQIVRLVTHNLDHILFLTVIVLFLVLFSTGVIL